MAAETGGNNYHADFERIIEALQSQSAFRDALKGQRFDFETDDGVRAATAALCRALGAEVVND